MLAHQAAHAIRLVMNTVRLPSSPLINLSSFSNSPAYSSFFPHSYHHLREKLANTSFPVCGGTTCGRDLSSAEIVARDFEVVSKRCKNDIGQTVPCTKAVEIEKRCKNDAGQTVPCTKKRTAEIEKRCKNDAGQTVPCTK